MPAKAMTLVLALAVPTFSIAQSADDATKNAVEARHGYMKMLSINMGQLGGMAKGEIEYDEAAASRAAANIVALTQYDLPPLFVEGTSSEEFEESNALPRIWETPEEFQKKYAGLVDAAAGSPEAVMGGQENLAEAVKKLGGACKACHDDYRKKE